MCVPIPPSVGTSNKAAGTTPAGSTTQPASGIDYSRYAGVSPYDVRTSNPNGLPANWDWNEWMRVNPGAPDPTTHTNTGTSISPQNAALWNTYTPAGQTAPVSAPVTPATPAAGALPAGVAKTPTLAATLPGTLATDVSAALNPAATPAAPATQAPQDVTPQVDPNTSLHEQVGGNLGIPATGTYSGATPVAYGRGSMIGDAPTTRVSNAIARRFKPEGWY